MPALCGLMLATAMPTEAVGPARLLAGDQDARPLRAVFGRFVARLLDRRLSPLGWPVQARKYLDWGRSWRLETVDLARPRLEVERSLAGILEEAVAR